MSSPDQRRSRVPRAERETQMLDVAEAVFAEKGFSAATMDEIAEKVGVTKPLIYDYFGSKEGLLSAAVERSRRALLGVLVQAWQDGDGRPIRERLTSVFVAWFSFMNSRDRGYIVLRSEGALVGEAGESIERIRVQTAKALGVGLAMVPSIQDASEGRLSAISEMMIGAAERLAIHRAVVDGMSADEAAELVMSVFWDGMLASGTTPATSA